MPTQRQIGDCDLQFTIQDTAGTNIGTLNDEHIKVPAGMFTVELNFGVAAAPYAQLAAASTFAAAIGNGFEKIAPLRQFTPQYAVAHRLFPTRSRKMQCQNDRRTKQHPLNILLFDHWKNFNPNANRCDA